jgi:Uma2 family endonuclease
MSAVTEVLESWGREITLAELDALPDDGRRHELIDGALIVTPAPAPLHQIVSGALYLRLHEAAPRGLTPLFAPLDVRVDDRNNLQPDLLVAPREAFTETNLPVAPLLAVEVISPSTKHIDRGLKKNKYEELGTVFYWVVDPVQPSITAWELVDGRYVEAGHAQGDEALVLERPFPVRIVPQELVP